MTIDRRSRVWLSLAAANGFVAVAAGAFGAHGVADALAKDLLKTGAQYQLIHALAVLACFAAWRAGVRLAALAAWLFLGGCLLFPGSLYLMALAGARWAGPITPVGGLLFLAGWATLAAAPWLANRKTV